MLITGAYLEALWLVFANVAIYLFIILLFVLGGFLFREISITDQVDRLIKQATSVDNLCNMYEGWTPWI